MAKEEKSSNDEKNSLQTLSSRFTKVPSITSEKSVFKKSFFNIASIILIIFIHFPLNVLYIFQKSAINGSSFTFLIHEILLNFQLPALAYIVVCAIVVFLSIIFSSSALISAISNAFIVCLFVCMIFKAKDAYLIIVSCFICFLILFVLYKTSSKLVFILTRAALTCFLILNLVEFNVMPIFSPILGRLDSNQSTLKANVIFIVVLGLSILVSLLMNIKK